MWNGTAAACLGVPQKAKHRINIWPTKSITVYTPKEQKTGIHSKTGIYGCALFTVRWKPPLWQHRQSVEGWLSKMVCHQHGIKYPLCYSREKPSTCEVTKLTSCVIRFHLCETPTEMNLEAASQGLAGAAGKPSRGLCFGCGKSRNRYDVCTTLWKY